MEDTVYLSTLDVLGLHAFTMRQTGDQPAPLRDAGLLESALDRPRMAAYYSGADLVRQAAILGVALSQAQSFLDGNKRTAYTAVVAFLRLNGARFIGEPLEMAQWLERIVERSGNEAIASEFESWLRKSVAPA